MNLSLVWMYFFLTLLLVMIILVPKKRIVRLIPFGIGGGLIVATVMQYFAINLFHFWKFNIALISILNIPLGVLLAWIPPVIVFANFWPKINQFSGKFIYILFFSLGTTILEYAFVITDARTYLNWNVYLTFLLALAIHLGLAYYLSNRTKILSKLNLKY